MKVFGSRSGDLRHIDERPAVFWVAEYFLLRAERSNIFFHSHSMVPGGLEVMS
jgi:hypothetical protein